MEKSVGACARFKAAEVGCANHDSPSPGPKPGQRDPSACRRHYQKCISHHENFFGQAVNTSVLTGMLISITAGEAASGHSCLKSQVAEETRSWLPVSPAEYADCIVSL